MNDEITTIDLACAAMAIEGWLDVFGDRTADDTFTQEQIDSVKKVHERLVRIIEMGKSSDRSHLRLVKKPDDIQ